MNDFERDYLDLFWKRQRLQWENYALSAGHDLSSVDIEIFKVAVLHQSSFDAPGRNNAVLKSVVIRALVDSHPDVANLRNRLDERFTAMSTPGTIECRVMLARAIKPDVLALMEMRNLLARGLGFPSYVALMLFTEDLDPDLVISLLKSYVSDNLATARDLVARYDIHPLTWYSDIERMDVGVTDCDTGKLAARLFGSLGLCGVEKAITIISQESGLSGYAGVLSVPDDIRILIRPVHSLNRWLTLFHELGHATAHALNKERGILKTWTASYDEAMAILMEHVAVIAMSDAIDTRKAGEILLLNGMECALSALFEFSLWEHPESAEQLYAEQYEQLGVSVPYPENWVLSSFRSLDPVYVHNYVPGITVAERTIRFLQQKCGKDFVLWGKWLQENYYADGRKRSLQEKTAIVGGLA